MCSAYCAHHYHQNQAFSVCHHKFRNPPVPETQASKWFPIQNQSAQGSSKLCSDPDLNCLNIVNMLIMKNNLRDKKQLTIDNPRKHL